MSVCSSSDLPEPVVPATRACGPSARTSSQKCPSASSPMTAFVVRLHRSQAASTASAFGSGIGRTSRSREEVGIVESAPEAETSWIGASARATRSHQPFGSRSRVTRSTSSTSVCDTLAAPTSAVTTARHSSGRAVRSRSMHTRRTPACGPRRSTEMRPGRRRRPRAPSSTTRICSCGPVVDGPRRSLSSRRSTSSEISLMRRAIVSSSSPTRARAPMPSKLRRWGSHLVHAQRPARFSPRAGSTRSTICSSAGECSTAA